MKFSYTLIKKFVPGIKNKTQLVRALNLHAFETEGGRGDTIEVAIPPNRYSDAASHSGIAREAAAILNLKYKEAGFSKFRKSDFRKVDSLKIEVRDKNLCPRYIAQSFENIKVKPSPKWIQEVLKECGLKPINNVVDIMNYAMLETGQPLHAFDADKLATSDKRPQAPERSSVRGRQETRKIIVRRAKRGESITSIDGVRYTLTPEMLVISDQKRALAIAGVKGGRGSEVTSETKRIIVESANFDSVSIYKTSKALNLVTDASTRFSHGLHPELVAVGISRAAELLKKIVHAGVGERSDSLTKPFPRHILKFDIQEFNRFIGMRMSEKVATDYLRRLGFKKVGGSKWEIPVLRQDINNHQDLAEEVIRLFGYNKLKAEAPHVVLRSSESDEMLLFKDKTRKILSGFGLDEIYNYSFISDHDAKTFVFDREIVGLKNPISSEFQHLRPSLVPNLLKSAKRNARFFDEVRVFETGQVFIKTKKKVSELTILGILLASKNKETFFELKGLVDQLLKALGLVDYTTVEPGKDSWVRGFTRKYIEKSTLLEAKSNKKEFAYFGKVKDVPEDWNVSVFEVDMERLLGLVQGEREYEPLSKHPSVMRDISLLVNISVRIGDVIQEIQRNNLHLIRDVDLVDEYRDSKWDTRQSITLRIVFQADDRTLTSKEIDREMEKITSMLQLKFRARVR